MKILKQCPVCQTDFYARQNQIYSTKCKNKEHNNNRKINIYDEYRHQKIEIEKLKSQIFALKLSSELPKEEIKPIFETITVHVPDKTLLEEIEIQKEIIEELTKNFESEKNTTEKLRNELKKLRNQLSDDKKDIEIKRLQNENKKINELAKNKMQKIYDIQKEIKSNIEYKVKNFNELKKEEIRNQKVNTVVGKLGGLIGTALFK